MFTINVKNEMTDKTLCNILQIAFEGGINYWCREVGLWECDEDDVTDRSKTIRPYKFEGNQHYKFIADAFNLDYQDEDDYYKYSIGFTMLEPHDRTHIHFIQHDDLVRGLQTWCENTKAFSLGLDLDNLDAGDCDEIVQIALFGKVIYG